ncbi:thioester reductase domain-containing protein [Hyalangium rubrum]|uniref:Thioester reductase domain-containing protein n=1 Tax=Hyalangium rubrum TaxID=3103134 RepID=A0ABU5H271_9BACT|nr:thioester reductase domain-containing protein [Hyalangium sp. s54d21]MDY7227214.1 thioester reductase domain-containing protein [Hyalangium sp. s54d21]
MTPPPRTLGELLRQRAERTPDARAYTFLADGETETESLTYAELDQQASAIAARIHALGGAGERALLLYPPGLDFIAAFFGCLYADTVAVPVFPPAPSGDDRGLARLRGIAQNARLRLLLTTEAITEMAEALLPGAPELAQVQWLATDAVAREEAGRLSPSVREGLAFLQYTSGSTSSPKGVRVSHANLLHNLEYGNAIEQNDASSVSVSWLPVYHDMGLIEGTLLPLFGGYPAYLMPPGAFLQRPTRWLEALSRYGATNSGGPNFAYELCLRKVSPEQRERLDLSRWRVAYNGAEPVRRETLERFVQTFTPQGLRWKSILPVYGLAEATLVVTGSRRGTTPSFRDVDAATLRAGEAIEPLTPDTPTTSLVGCGESRHGVEVLIVAPQTRTRREERQVGEIWIAGPSVAEGYWDNTEATARTFGARLADGAGPYLRTGDLGFLREGELFVTGRIKDVLILRGKNHYPQDLERTVEQVHPALRPGCIAAFSIEHGGEERAVVLAEVEPRKLLEPESLPSLLRAIRTEVAARHGIALHAVSLVPPKTLPKTSSGKLQRFACREAFLEGSMSELARDVTAQPAPSPTVAPEAEPVLAMLLEYVALQIGVPADSVDPQLPLTRSGLDSLGLMGLLEVVSREAGRELRLEELLEHPHLESLARLATGERSEAPAADRLEVMLADAVLPPEIAPADAAPPRSGPPRDVLLTGATGFLGAQLLRDLLVRTSARVHCLVRAAGGLSSRARLRAALQARGLWEDSFEARLTVVEGDLGLPLLGLDEALFDALARSTDAVIHSAAAVNWVFPYSALREQNVVGTRTLLALASLHRRKPFHFVSSQLVCHSSLRAPRQVLELEDMLPELPGLHLGYAQTKCVAEHLARAAANRGLPVRIYRPPFLFGSSATGHCATDDFLAALIKGCVQMGSAPDMDWELDCCPVDFVSRMILEVASREPSGFAVLHPVPPRARHWRECVLWMSLLGYPVHLTPYGEWLRQLQREAAHPEHALHYLRSFFLRRRKEAGGLTLPELYETGRRNRITSRLTRQELAGWDVPCPPLDAHLLDRYFASFIEQGHLPAVPRHRQGERHEARTRVEPALLERALRQVSAKARLLEAHRMERLGEHGITTELTAWRHSRGLGLFRYQLQHEAGVLPVVVKVKPSDEEVLDVATRVAHQCHPQLGQAFARFPRLLGFTGTHVRELELYAQKDPRFTRHAPACLAAHRDDEARRWLLVLEDLQPLELLDSADTEGAWSRPHLEAAVRGAASLHAIGLGSNDWTGLTLPPPVTTADMVSAGELWRALESHSRECFAQAGGGELPALHRQLVEELGRWWEPLERLPRTLIHNDFNPRNLALRQDAEGLRLCAYDWELATLGLPQHDLAELLCFTLTERTSTDEVEHYLELHRATLERESGRPMDPAAWELGFRASLGDLLVNRLAAYTVAHRFRRQRFLERVLKTWRRLHELFPLVTLEQRARRATGS